MGTEYTMKGGLDRRQVKIFKALMRRAKIKHKKHLMHLVDPEQSEKYPTGRVSTKIYQKVFQERRFDCYFRQVSTKLSAKEEAVLKLTKRLACVTQNEKRIEKQSDDVIGLKKPSYGPPGLAPAPTLRLLENHGNDIFYNYEGPWKNGKMEGESGIYYFADGKTFKGHFINGRAHGYGEAIYANGTSYTGKWELGFQSGDDGLATYAHGSTYSGTWKQGKRHGHGSLQLHKSGVTYLGDFNSGKLHGLGVWKSPSTGISISGTFKRGFLNGAFTISWPSGTQENHTIHRYGGFTFKQVIDELYAQKKRDFEFYKKDRDAVFAVRYAVNLQNHVDKVRTRLYKERKALKDQAEHERLDFIREKRLKLKQARDAALDDLVKAADQRGKTARQTPEENTQGEALMLLTSFDAPPSS